MILYYLAFGSVAMFAGATIQKFASWRRLRMDRLDYYRRGQRNMLANVGPYCRLCDSNHIKDDDMWRACNHVPAVYQTAGYITAVQHEDEFAATVAIARQDPEFQAEYAMALDVEVPPTQLALPQDNPGYDPNDDGPDVAPDDADPDAWIYQQLAPVGSFWGDGDPAYTARSDTVPATTHAIAARVAQAPEVAWNDSGPILVYPTAELAVPDFPPSEWMLNHMREHEQRMAAITVDAKCWAIGVPDRTDQEASLILARELVAV